MAGRRRLDAELVRRGFAESRAQAGRLIEAGQVLVGGAPAAKAARLVSPDDPLTLTGPPPRYVSRGGEKLAAALQRFPVPVRGVEALDAGSSTGGFTDCLLQAGAGRVVAVDVGRGQLHEKLRADPRVAVYERTDVRSLRPGAPPVPPGGFGLVVADLSFISIRSVAGALVDVARPGGDLVILVKPQFEAGRAEAGAAKGVIRDPAIWERVLRAAVTNIGSRGAVIMGIVVSPLRGAEGNVEFLTWFRRIGGGAGAEGVGAGAGAVGAGAGAVGAGAPGADRGPAGDLVAGAVADALRLVGAAG